MPAPLASLGFREVVGLLVSVLPSEVKKHPLLAPYATPGVHVASGIVETVAGVWLFFAGMFRWLEGFLLGPGWLYFTLPSPPGAVEGQLRFPASLGLLGFLSFLLTPYAWLCLFATFEGALRALDVVFHGSLPGLSPVVGVWRLGVKGKEMLGRARRAMQAGPSRPDRLQQLADGRLELVSFRHYPWRSGQVVEIEEAFYVLVRVMPVRDGSYSGFRYLLRPLEPGEIIRGQLVRYRELGQNQNAASP
ncbi:MAG: hypothetical protein ACUVRQ_03160 [Thermoanaerobaculaceae bacterium]